MSASKQCHRSVLRDCGYILLPTMFFIHFTVTGTVVLIYTLVMHRPTPTKYTIGAAITFAIILSMLAAIHLLLYCKRRLGKGYAGEKSSTSGSSSTDNSDSKLRIRLRNLLQRYSKNSQAFQWYKEKMLEREQRKKEIEEKRKPGSVRNDWRQSDDSVEPDPNAEPSCCISRKSPDHGSRGNHDDEHLQPPRGDEKASASTHRSACGLDEIIVIHEGYQNQNQIQVHDLRKSLAVPKSHHYIHDQTSHPYLADPSQQYEHAAFGAMQLPRNGMQVRQAPQCQKSHSQQIVRLQDDALQKLGDMIPIRHPSPNTMASVTQQRHESDQQHMLAASFRGTGYEKISPHSNIRFYGQAPNEVHVQPSHVARQVSEHHNVVIPIASGPANLPRQDAPHKRHGVISSAESPAGSQLHYNPTYRAYRSAEQYLPQHKFSGRGLNEKPHVTRNSMRPKEEVGRKASIRNAGVWTAGPQQRPPMLRDYTPYQHAVRQQIEDDAVPHALNIALNDDTGAASKPTRTALGPSSNALTSATASRASGPHIDLIRAEVQDGAGKVVHRDKLQARRSEERVTYDRSTRPFHLTCGTGSSSVSRATEQQQKQETTTLEGGAVENYQPRRQQGQDRRGILNNTKLNPSLSLASLTEKFGVVEAYLQLT